MVSSSASVAGGGVTIVTEGADSTPSAPASSIVSATLTGASGCPGPKSYWTRASSHATTRRPVIPVHLPGARSHHARPGGGQPTGAGTLRTAQFLAAVAGRLDRCEERGAHPVFLKFPDRGDRRASRRRHGFPQDDRVLPGVPQHRRRAVYRLGDHFERGPPRHAEQDARVHHGLDQVVDISGPAAR